MIGCVNRDDKSKLLSPGARPAEVDPAAPGVRLRAPGRGARPPREFGEYPSDGLQGLVTTILCLINNFEETFMV